MNRYIFYSILRYKHSIATGESLNVGLIFSFPGTNELVFVEGDAERVEAIYPGVSLKLLDKTLSGIKKKSVKCKNAPKTQDSFMEYIAKNILLEDSTSLQFSEIYTALDVLHDTENTIDQYTRILLPSMIDKTLQEINEL